MVVRARSAAFEEPVGEVGSLAQLRDRDVDGASAGIEVAVPVPVSPVDAFVGHGPVAGTTHGVGGQERVDEGGEHVPEEIGTCLGEVLFEEACRVDTGCDGHRGVSFSRGIFDGSSRRITRWPPLS